MKKHKRLKSQISRRPSNETMRTAVPNPSQYENESGVLNNSGMCNLILPFSNEMDLQKHSNYKGSVNEGTGIGPSLRDSQQDIYD